jgi:hypothetical protein
MNSIFDSARRMFHKGALAAGLAGVALYAQSAPALHADPTALVGAAKHIPTVVTTVLDFDATTWAQLLKQGPRPAAYVFTNSFCPNCPQTFAALHKAVVAAGKSVPLSAILMDVQGERALAHAHHYIGVSRIYAFEGFEPAIRQAIDAKWRNVTPYVVMVDRQGKLQRVTGQPDAKQMKAWLR